jgi:hypothetical protein
MKVELMSSARGAVLRSRKARRNETTNLLCDRMVKPFATNLNVVWVMMMMMMMMMLIESLRVMGDSIFVDSPLRD